MDQSLTEFFNQTDPNNWDSITAKNCYGIHPPDFQGAYVIDIGANIGIFSHVALDMGAKWVFAVEPSPSVLPVLVSHASPRMTVLNMAVSGYTGVGHVAVSEAIDASCLSPQGGHEVPVITLASLMRFIPVGAKIMVKVDSEGCEYDTLYSTSKEVLDRITTLCVEFHDTQHDALSDYTAHVKKHPLHTEAYLLQYLIKMGFSSVWALNFYEVVNGQTVSSPVSVRKFVH